MGSLKECTDSFLPFKVLLSVGAPPRGTSALVVYHSWRVEFLDYAGTEQFTLIPWLLGFQNT